MTDSQPFLYPLLFAVAFLYAAVGHGGASGYLAVMALSGIAPEVMKPTALVLNLFVACGAFLLFRRAHHFRRDLLWPLALCSVPMSFLGGLILLEAHFYRHLLGAVLLLPIVRLLFVPSPEEGLLNPVSRPALCVIGGVIGLLSGMIGIGGGILLSPILLWRRWTTQQQTAAVSAPFILLNSAAGLLGLFTRQVHFAPGMLGYVLPALAGGLIGAWLGASRFRSATLNLILAVVLALAAGRLLFTGG